VLGGMLISDIAVTLLALEGGGTAGVLAPASGWRTQVIGLRGPPPASASRMRKSSSAACQGR
jgi:hypothetical protein